MNNIVLIGMPSSGKSTAGVILAKRLGYCFLDCDLLIQEREGALLSELIERHGAEGFISIEEEVCASVCAEHCVIATGGSVVYGARAMEHFKQLGKVVYLKLGQEQIERRIPNLVRRGVVMRGSVSNVAELLAERAPLYEKYADAVVACDGQTVEETVSAIVAVVGKKL